jgi:hypothetical protein
MLKLHRSLSLANQISQYIEVWERSPRSTILPKEFVISPLYPPWILPSAKEVTSKFPSCKSFVVLVGSLQLSCGMVPQPPFKGFGRRLQDHRLVESELASMACSPENKVSLCGVG